MRAYKQEDCVAWPPNPQGRLLAGASHANNGWSEHEGAANETPKELQYVIIRQNAIDAADV